VDYFKIPWIFLVLLRILITAGLGEFSLSGNTPPVFNKSGKSRIFFRLGKPVRRRQANPTGKTVTAKSAKLMKPDKKSEKKVSRCG